MHLNWINKVNQTSICQCSLLLVCLLMVLCARDEVTVICEYCCHVFSSRRVQAHFLRTGSSIFTPPASTSRHQHVTLQSGRTSISHGGNSAYYSLSAVSCLVQIPTLVVLATWERVRATGSTCARLSQVLKVAKRSVLNAHCLKYHSGALFEA